MADFPILIIGAGASGMAAAIAASRVCPHSVLLLEKESRVGRKLLATGNGRCNLLNMHVPKGCFHGGGAHIAHALASAMPPADVLSWFADLGLVCREEADGRVYPFSGQASAVLDVLRAACDRYGAQSVTREAVQSVSVETSGFRVVSSGKTFFASRLIIAGGGRASPALGSDGSTLRLLASMGHTITPLLPAIVPLKTPVHPIRGLKGVRCQASLALLDDDGKPMQTETGEALFTDYGISGIVAMQLGRLAGQMHARGKGCRLRIRLMPPEMAQAEVEKRRTLFAGQPMDVFCTGLLHPRLALCLLRQAGIAPQAPVTDRATQALAPLLSDWQLPVEGTLSFPQAQVTAGGALASEFNPETLGSYIVPGLYACGEALDVDGSCGGYNLLWAWLSGITAGTAAAASLS